jgi:FG-GAP repeat
MCNPCRCLALFLLVLFLRTTAAAAASGPFALLHSLFDSGTNAQVGAQQGFSVAVDGNIAVVGAPLDSVGARTAGTVKVYDASTGALLHTLVNPNPSAGEFFGWAVAISGNRIVVGANWDKGGTNVMGSAVGGAYIYELTGSVLTLPTITLTNPSPASTDLFGHAVAISGTRVVIGTPGDDTDGTDSGIAYVYDLASSTPSVPQFVFNNPSPATNEGFGVAVAISGTRVVVATPWDGTGATFAGSAYVFDLTSATPAVPVITLNNPSPAANDQFGYSVAISGTRLVVGANQDDTGATDAGSAYVYDLASATPDVPVVTLNNPSPATGDNFGLSVAISGTRVAVGAVYDDTGTTNAGSAYVYELAGATPTVPVAILNNPSPAVGDYFGNAVSISGTRIAVGAPYDDIGATDAGIAYIYNLAGATPAVPAAILARPSPAFADYFGRAVAISGTRVVVGADGDDTGATEAGRVYVYNLANATPRLPIAVLNNPSPAIGDFFGWSVAISGTRVVVGAYGDDTGATNAGIAYVYDLASATPTIPLLVLTNPSPAVSDQFSYSVGISGTRVVVGALFDDTGANNAGSAYVYDLASVRPAVPIATLNNPTPAANDRFGSAVAISGTRVVIGAYQDDSVSPDAGSAYVYDLASASPNVPVVTLGNPAHFATTDTDYFGYSVAISDARVVVGAYRGWIRGLDAGSAYVYDLTSTTPAVPVATLNNPNPTDFEYFGWAVSISGTRVLIGAPRTDVGGTDVGSAYLYDMTSATPTVSIATFNNPSPALADYFGWAVAIDGMTVVTSAFNDDTNAEDRGAAYIFGPVPSLSIAPAAPGFATLSWTPPTSSSFVLQYADSLAPTNWFNAPSAALNPVTIPLTNAARFHRLFQP